MEINKLFASYNISMNLRNLGFNEQCFAWYANNKILRKQLDVQNSQSKLKGQCTAPLYQQVVDWFRKEYDMHIYVDFYDVYTFAIKLHGERMYNRHGAFELKLKSYEEACEQMILKAIELIKANKV